VYQISFCKKKIGAGLLQTTTSLDEDSFMTDTEQTSASLPPLNWNPKAGMRRKKNAASEWERTSPQVLPRKHCFCTSCTSRIIGNKYTITCPLCRGEFLVPKKTAVECRFMNYLSVSAPWLPIESGMKTSEVLLFLAAGAGSLFTLIWIIEKFSLDPLVVKSKGKNIAHVAASNSRMAVCKWLNENGFAELFQEEDGRLTPVHLAMSSKSLSHKLILYFEYLNLFPENWLEYAKKNSLESMKTWIQEEEDAQTIQKMMELLRENASLEKFQEFPCTDSLPCNPPGYPPLLNNLVFVLRSLSFHCHKKKRLSRTRLVINAVPRIKAGHRFSSGGRQVVRS
jgi:hypothetical protein